MNRRTFVLGSAGAAAGAAAFKRSRNREARPESPNLRPEPQLALSRQNDSLRPKDWLRVNLPH